METTAWSSYKEGPEWNKMAPTHVMIHQCRYIHYRSSGGYEELRQSGALNFPLTKHFETTATTLHRDSL